MGIKKVTLAGATGNLGPAILNSLLKSKRFDVTVLTRKGSSYTFPATVTVQHVDYSSESSLVAALQGQDAVISALSSVAVNTQKVLINAAIAAGVQRFLPSEFGSNSKNPEVAKIPIFSPKVQIQEYLHQKSTELPLFSYSLIFNGAFLDWGLATGMLVDIKGKKVDLQDGGDVPFSVSRLSTVGDAVVGVLSHPQETANRAILVKDADVTQNQLVTAAKEIAPTGEWLINNVSTEAQEAEAYESFAKGHIDVSVIAKFLFRAVYGEGYGGRLENVDNELLGLKGLDETGVKEVIKSILSS